MIDLPLTRFEGYVRCLHRDRLNEVGAAALELACPGFLAKDPSVETLQKMAALERMDAIYVETRPHRRFSGDDSFPPGRYHSVASTANGTDGFTLKRELPAYLEPERIGWVWPADLAEQADLNAAGLGGRPRDALALLFRSAEHQVAVELPLVTNEATIDQCIDLRRSETQQWFFQTFKTGDGDLISKPNGAGITSFLEMLPALMWPAFAGGSSGGVGSVIRAIGTWMRVNPVSALIYPSARANVGIKVESGEPVSYYGWNLVDYRDASPTMGASAAYQRIHDFSPWPKAFSYPAQIAVAPDDGPFAGSWQVRGVEEWHFGQLQAKLDTASANMHRTDPKRAGRKPWWQFWT